jgi:hypothetical protein
VGLFTKYHHCENEDTFAELGRDHPDDTLEISSGMLGLYVPCASTALELDYDVVIVMGPVFRTGGRFSGGNNNSVPASAPRGVQFHP